MAGIGADCGIMLIHAIACPILHRADEAAAPAHHESPVPAFRKQQLKPDVPADDTLHLHICDGVFSRISLHRRDLLQHHIRQPQLLEFLDGQMSCRLAEGRAVEREEDDKRYGQVSHNRRYAQNPRAERIKHHFNSNERDSVLRATYIGSAPFCALPFMFKLLRAIFKSSNANPAAGSPPAPAEDDDLLREIASNISS